MKERGREGVRRSRGVTLNKRIISYVYVFYTSNVSGKQLEDL